MSTIDHAGYERVRAAVAAHEAYMRASTVKVWCVREIEQGPNAKVELDELHHVVRELREAGAHV